MKTGLIFQCCHRRRRRRRPRCLPPKTLSLAYFHLQYIFGEDDAVIVSVVVVIAQTLRAHNK